MFLYIDTTALVAEDMCGDGVCQNGGACLNADAENPSCDCLYTYTGEYCESGEILQIFHIFNPFSAGTVFIRQNLTYKDRRRLIT